MPISSFLTFLNSLNANIYFNWLAETTLPQCHLMEDFLYSHPHTVFCWSPELLVCSSATYFLFLMLLNNGSSYLLALYVFIEHLQSIMYFAGYW